MKSQKTALIILDGWGHGDQSKSDAIHHANTPFIDSLYSQYPNCELLTFGEHVGLPKGQMGNSEVGHLNIGAGRVVHQDLERINLECKNNKIFETEGLRRSMSNAKKHKTSLHILGLLSDGGIHSHQDHLYKICEAAKKSKIKNVFIHIFTDGRDTDPKSGKKFIKQLMNNLHGARIATICGRYYAMDRDQRWERIKKAYDLLVKGKGEKTQDILSTIEKSYSQGITDEFINPIVKINESGMPIGKIKDNDTVICFNFRTDRCRQITSVLTQSDMPELDMKTIDVHFTTMTNYDKKFKNIHIIYNKENIKNTIGEVIANNGLSQIRISETEKYPHVTFFLSGGKEEKFKNEKRILIPSPKVATYDLLPEMSARSVTSRIVDEIHKQKSDFICLNFANTDMVGHTGNYNAILKAIETIDDCAKKVIESCIKNNYACLIISDHGNADISKNSDGSPNTAHTTNPVPCFLINSGYDNIENGKLCDVAPTILHIMGIETPEQMTGKTLIK